MNAVLRKDNPHEMIGDDKFWIWRITSKKGIKAVIVQNRAFLKEMGTSYFSYLHFSVNLLNSLGVRYDQTISKIYNDIEALEIPFHGGITLNKEIEKFTKFYFQEHHLNFNNEDGGIVIGWDFVHFFDEWIIFDDVVKNLDQVFDEIEKHRKQDNSSNYDGGEIQ